jgi:hypothetical protein
MAASAAGHRPLPGAQQRGSKQGNDAGGRAWVGAGGWVGDTQSRPQASGVGGGMPGGAGVRGWGGGTGC